MKELFKYIPPPFYLALLSIKLNFPFNNKFELFAYIPPPLTLQNKKNY